MNRRPGTSETWRQTASKSRRPGWCQRGGGLRFRAGHCHQWGACDIMGSNPDARRNPCGFRPSASWPAVRRATPGAPSAFPR
ncbi:MAG: hypothetical protein ACFFA6_17720 [Promethearchaeota archaeon]